MSAITHFSPPADGQGFACMGISKTHLKSKRVFPPAHRVHSRFVQLATISMHLLRCKGWRQLEGRPTATTASPSRHHLLSATWTSVKFATWNLRCKTTEQARRPRQPVWQQPITKAFIARQAGDHRSQKKKEKAAAVGGGRAVAGGGGPSQQLRGRRQARDTLWGEAPPPGLWLVVGSGTLTASTWHQPNPNC